MRGYTGGRTPHLHHLQQPHLELGDMLVGWATLSQEQGPFTLWIGFLMPRLSPETVERYIRSVYFFLFHRLGIYILPQVRHDNARLQI